ncbi:hypothetical protein D3C78_880200 [compost metagenome]
MTTVAGQVNKHQIFRAATLGQRACRAGKVFAGCQGPVLQMVTVIDQLDLTDSTEAALEQAADIIDFAQEYALIAITGQGQAIQLYGGC